TNDLLEDPEIQTKRPDALARQTNLPRPNPSGYSPSSLETGGRYGHSTDRHQGVSATQTRPPARRRELHLSRSRGLALRSLGGSDACSQYARRSARRENPFVWTISFFNPGF